jgi:transposase InsO family protein
MDDQQLVVTSIINKKHVAQTLIDHGCTSAACINSLFADTCQLAQIDIPPKKIEGFNGETAEISKVAQADLCVGAHEEKDVFLYCVPNLEPEVILGKAWLKENNAVIDAATDTVQLKPPKNETTAEKPKPTLISAAAFSMWARRARKNPSSGIRVFAASVADIEKALSTKAPPDPRNILPSQYHDFLDAFSRPKADQLPPHRPGDHRIDTMEGKDIPWGPMYNMSKEELLVLRKTLNEYLDKGFIRVSSSPAAAPVLFVRKPNGGLRFCVDYRALNAITKKDRYPLPLIKETLTSIGKARYFTKLDVIAAFHKIRIAEGDEWKTAFRTRFGLYEWMVTPFGLANAPSTFQRYINSALHGYLDDFCSAYIDDVLIYTDGDIHLHRQHVKMVLERLNAAGLQLDIEKCEFEVQRTKYLGFIVEAGVGISMDPKKVEAIQRWETPRSVKAVQSFLGFANFYRRFISHYSDLTAPLVELTRKDKTFNWTPAADNAFERLKSAFISAPILTQFDSTRETVLETDSSGYCVGGVLSQVVDGILHPVAYYSRKNAPAECNYEIHDKELLAVIRCLDEWDPELRSVDRFCILTDHKNLEYFGRLRKLTERQMRWALILSKYQFDLIHRPGKENIRSDVLSRREQDMPQELDDRLTYREKVLLPESLWKQKPKISQISSFRSAMSGNVQIESRPVEELPIVETSPIQIPSAEKLSIEELWKQSEESDVELKHATQAVTAGERTFPASVGYRVSVSECSVDGKMLLFRGRRWVPKNDILRTRIIQEAHDSMLTGHPGRETLSALLRREVFWPGIDADIRRFCRNCDDCGQAKAWRSRRQGLLKPLPIPDRTWQELSMDFVTDLPVSDGCTNLLIVTDRLSKGVILEPMKTITAEALAEVFIKSVFRRHGLPRAIVSDRGPQFVGLFWERLCKRLNIVRRLSTAYHPETDGSTERMNQTVETYLRLFTMYEQHDWAKLCPLAEFAINNRDSASTGVSPFFLAHGFNAELFNVTISPTNETSPIGRADRIARKISETVEWCTAAMAEAQQMQENSANRSREPAVSFKIGDRVWLNLRNIKTERPCKKLDWKNGKFTVTEKIGSHAYRLNTPPGIHNVFNVQLLRLANSDPLPGQKVSDPQPPAILVDGEEEYEVESILKERLKGKNRERQLLVKWRGYAKPTWEPAKALEDTAAYDLFERRGE